MGHPPTAHDYLGLGLPTAAVHSVATSPAASTFLVAPASYTIYIARHHSKGKRAEPIEAVAVPSGA
ncbi:hypothetical protein E2562_032773 [Oryza meyeriana var. granulata]|uniref:Uncharacterized protein n=1 Tax=Oryza meyeriana var. granulata TaxID=110450 RepID=A0A6G1F0T8_9ORYZ|nr:hypothetical protein E2562_032773 [Oryza meyeriana var. granulata]